MTWYRFPHTIVIVLATLAIAICPEALAGPITTPVLKAKHCSAAVPTKVQQNGQVLTFEAGGKLWTLSIARQLIALTPSDSSSLAGASPRAVVWTRDRRLQLKAESDGTIRWFSSDKRNLRLSLCFDADSEGWVVYTPSGYYIRGAKDSGKRDGRAVDDLVGWEIPVPDSVPDFFPLSVLEKHLGNVEGVQSLEIIKRALSTPNMDEEDIAAAVAREDGREPEPLQIQKLLPPVLTITSGSADIGGSDKVLNVQIGYRRLNDQPFVIRVAGEGVLKSVPIPVESQESEHLSAGVGPATPAHKSFRPSFMKTVTVPVDLPAADSTLVVSARTVDLRVESKPITLPLRGRGSSSIEDLPVVYLVAIGVNRYQDKMFGELKHAEKDAGDFAKALCSQVGRSYRKVVKMDVKATKTEGDACAVEQTKAIAGRVSTTDETSRSNTTKEAVLAQLAWLQTRELRSSDLAVLFLSGHGIRNGEAGGYYFPPADAVYGDPTGTMIAASELQRYVANRNGGKMLVFLDTCYSGGVLSPAKLQELTREIARVGNVVVFSSSTTGQVSQEWEKWGNGAFTKAVVESLHGDSDSEGTGLVTVNQLDYYVSRRVRELTSGDQTPTSVRPSAITDFEIARVRAWPWRKRKVRWAMIGSLAASLTTGAILFGVFYHPPYETGNSGWLVNFKQ